MEVKNLNGFVKWLDQFIPDEKWHGAEAPDYTYNIQREMTERREQIQTEKKNRNLLYLAIAATIGIFVAQKI